MGSCISTIQKNNTSSAKIQMSQDNNNNNSSIPSTPIKHNHKPKPKPKPEPAPTTLLPVDPPLIISNSFKSRVSPFHSVSSYRSHGSREEAFYDTQGWLESDCEDDFYSVNGDFTPSRGNTPVHPSIGTPRLHKTFSPQVNKAVFDVRLSNASLRSRGSTPVRRSFSSVPGVTGNLPEGATGISQEPALKPKKKRLADLFRESMRERGGFGVSFPGYESDGSQRIGTSPNNPALPPKPRKGTSPLAGPQNVSPPNNYVLEKDKSSRFSQRCFPRLVSIRSFNENKKTSSRASSVDD